MEIDFNNIKTLFLDAGNTLVSMDLEWFASELEKFDIYCPVEDLKHAEGSARPIVSSAIQRLKSTESKSTSVFYIQSILDCLPNSSLISKAKMDKIVSYMLTVISADGQTQRVWNNILPGVPEALKILKNAGLQLSVVSNSNGTVRKILESLDLDNFFYEIFDSHVIGYEKPDPRIFTHAIKACKADPETTVHVGDLYHVDVMGAWAANIKAVLLDPFGDWDDYECPRFPDLLTLAKKITNLE
ncbi:HAD family hydrolase [Thermodesulfobacteriota bacterium]